jgi:serine/threonine protein kinase
MSTEASLFPQENLRGYAGLEQYDLTLLDKLSPGGMSTVLKAVGIEDQMAVVKIPGNRYCSLTPELNQRFAREVLVHKELVGEGAVPVVTDGEIDTPAGRRQFLATEYMPGGTLSRRDLKDDFQGPSGAVQIARLIVPMALPTLAAMHAQGLVHRDIKPGNIMIDADDKGRLGDFGVVTVEGEAAPVLTVHTGEEVRCLAESLTQTEAIIGSPLCVSPEAVLRRPVHTPADVFSLGATMYYLTTDESPWGETGAPLVPSYDDFAESSSSVNYIELEPVPPHHYNSNVPKPFSDLVMQCLQVEPDVRPTVAEVIPALQKLT